MKKYKVIHTNAINVGDMQLETGDVFEADNKSNEIKTLLLNKYIEEAK